MYECEFSSEHSMISEHNLEVIRMLIFLPKVYLLSNENIRYIFKVLEYDKTQALCVHHF
jgi:hypothetical protein